MEATQGREIPTGLGTEEAMRRAETVWRRIQAGDMAALKAVCDPDRADEMHAMCRLVAREGGPSESSLRLVTLFYESAQQMSAP